MKRVISLALALIMCVSLLGMAAFADSERTPVSAKDWTVITIDPGHGGNAGGAYKWNGVQYGETELVLKIAYYLKEELESYHHVKVVMTRTDNSMEQYRPIYEIAQRVDVAAKYDSDLLISLHLNGANRANSAGGACVLVPNGNYRPELAQKDCELAKLIMRNLNSLGIGTYGKDGGLLVRNSEERPPDLNPNGTIADYYGIVRGGIWRNFMAVLVEHCFMDNYHDATSFLSSEEKLKALAHADASAIVEYFNLEKKTEAEQELNEYFLYDYRDCWAFEDIDKAVVDGWVRGFADDTFRPYESVTRGQFVTFLGRLEGADISTFEESAFPDVPADSFCAAYVQWAWENNIVGGYEDGTFRPNEKITREQIAKILAGTLAAKGVDISTDKTLDDFDISDKDSISDWAKEYVVFCYDSGLMNGKGGAFEPIRATNRAETCTVLSRMVRFMESYEPDDSGDVPDDGEDVPAEPPVEEEPVTPPEENTEPAEEIEENTEPAEEPVTEPLPDAEPIENNI